MAFLSVPKPLRDGWDWAGKVDSHFGAFKVLVLLFSAAITLLGVLLWTFGVARAVFLLIGLTAFLFGMALWWAGRSSPAAHPYVQPQRGVGGVRDAVSFKLQWGEDNDPPNKPEWAFTYEAVEQKGRRNVRLSVRAPSSVGTQTFVEIYVRHPNGSVASASGTPVLYPDDFTNALQPQEQVAMYPLQPGIYRCRAFIRHLDGPFEPAASGAFRTTPSGRVDPALTPS